MQIPQNTDAISVHVIESEIFIVTHQGHDRLTTERIQASTTAGAMQIAHAIAKELKQAHRLPTRVQHHNPEHPSTRAIQRNLNRTHKTS